MRIDTALRDLGPIDYRPLRDAVLAASEDDWTANRYRQQTFDAHYDTESLVMLFTDAASWPRITVVRESGWALLATAAQPLIEEIVARHYPPGGVVIRAMAARLAAGAIIKPHTDAHPSFHAGHRIHIPLASNSRARFTIDGRPHHLQEGRAYEINNQLMHSVMNRGREDRINFIFDYVPPSRLPGLEITESIDRPGHRGEERMEPAR